MLNFLIPKPYFMIKIDIKKSLLIKKEASHIFQLTNDFHHWPKWSPLLIADPTTSLNILETIFKGPSYMAFLIIFQYI